MTLPICTCIPHRYLVALFSFIIMLVSVGYRVSFALMITHIAHPSFNSSDKGNNTSLSDGDSLFSNCTAAANGRDKKVNWSGSTTFLFHTSYFAGQLVASIPAGALATRFSPKRMFGLTILATSILQLLLPVATDVIWLIYVIRCIQGMIEAVSVPAMNAVISAWAPKSERARLINIAYAGVYLAPALANFTTGATTCYVSWDSIMYIYGAVGGFMSIVWLLIIASKPSTHPVARREERKRLLQQPQDAPVPKKKPVSICELPWRKFFTSMPLIAVWVGSFCRNWIFAMLITEVQQYYKDVYHLPTVMNGLLSAVPHVFMVVFMLIGSWVFDIIAKKELLSVTNTRKLAQTLGFGVQGACIVIIGVLDNHIHVFILFCVGVAFSAFAISGFQTNPLDLAPQYAGALTGIARTGMVGSVLSTVLASQLTGQSPTLSTWQHLFIIAGSIHIAGVIFYLIFASGNLQPWAQTDINTDVNATEQQTNQAQLQVTDDDGTPSKLHSFVGSSNNTLADGAASFDDEKNNDVAGTINARTEDSTARSSRTYGSLSTGYRTKL